ncbi:MAG TPA: hypothetical protein VGM06_16825 [Polyangiaceae bacterium]
MKIRAAAAFLFVVFGAASADAKAEGTGAVARDTHARLAAHAVDPRPPARLALSLTTPTTHGAWTMRVTNEGDEPVRIVADARLLTLEVTPRGARAPVRCELPDDMRPPGDLDRVLVVPPGRSYVETFESRLFCLTAGQIDALSPGAIVVARLGWRSGSASSPPFIASAVEGADPGVAPLKWIEAPPIALPDEPTAWAAADTRPGASGDGDGPRLTLHGPPSVDAATTNEIVIPLTLHNEGRHAVVVQFRPETLDFDILRDGVLETCAWPTVPGSPLREMFTTLAPGASEPLEVTLSSYCTTGHGLDQAGLIVVWPRLDTHDASGAPLGMQTFNGQVVATAPTVVRLHRGAALKPPKRKAPELEPAAR